MWEALLGGAVSGLFSGLFGRGGGSRNFLTREDIDLFSKWLGRSDTAYGQLERAFQQMQETIPRFTTRFETIANALQSAIPDRPQLSPVFGAIMEQARRSVEAQMANQAMRNVPQNIFDATRQAMLEQYLPNALLAGYQQTEQLRTQNMAQAIDALSRAFVANQSLYNMAQGLAGFTTETMQNLRQQNISKQLGKAQIAAQQSASFANALGGLLSFALLGGFNNKR